MAAAPHDHQTRPENHGGAVRLALAVLVPVAVLTISSVFVVSNSLRLRTFRATALAN